MKRELAADSECAACGGDLVPTFRVETRFLECRDCGYALLAADGRRDYWESAGEDGHSEYWESAREKYFDAALERLVAVTHGRRLLDIGGGIGRFAELALAKGFDAYSLDLSSRATELAAERLGRERAWARVPDEALGTFDVVTLWCVVAHTRDPSSVLRAARSALGDGGVIWLTTPNFRFQHPYAAARRVLGRPLDFARDDHVAHFTARAIASLLSRHRFADVRFDYVGITETCVATGGNARALVAAKRLWNAAAHAAAVRGLGNAMSELQVLARAV